MRIDRGKMTQEIREIHGTCRQHEEQHQGTALVGAASVGGEEEGGSAGELHNALRARLTPSARGDHKSRRSERAGDVAAQETRCRECQAPVAPKTGTKQRRPHSEMSVQPCLRTSVIVIGPASFAVVRYWCLSRLIGDRLDNRIRNQICNQFCNHGPSAHKQKVDHSLDKPQGNAEKFSWRLLADRRGAPSGYVLAA